MSYVTIKQKLHEIFFPQNVKKYKLKYNIPMIFFKSNLNDEYL